MPEPSEKVAKKTEKKSDDKKGDGDEPEKEITCEL